MCKKQIMITTYIWKMMRTLLSVKNNNKTFQILNLKHEYFFFFFLRRRNALVLKTLTLCLITVVSMNPISIRSSSTIVNHTISDSKEQKMADG